MTTAAAISILDKSTTLALVLVNLALRHQALNPEVVAIADAMWKEGRALPNAEEQARLDAMVQASVAYRDGEIAKAESLLDARTVRDHLIPALNEAAGYDSPEALEPPSKPPPNSAR